MVYVDSSVLVAILFEPKAAERCLRILSKTKTIVSCPLLEAEVLSCVKRENASTEAAMLLLRSISILYVDRSLAKELGRIFSASYCKGADALHIAHALFLNPGATELRFFTLDTRQAVAANNVGFECL